MNNDKLLFCTDLTEGKELRYFERKDGSFYFIPFDSVKNEYINDPICEIPKKHMRLQMRDLVRWGMISKEVF